MMSENTVRSRRIGPCDKTATHSDIVKTIENPGPSSENCGTS